MKAQQHTPGPWIKHDTATGLNIADPTKNFDVCSISNRYSPPGAANANARLIAAAPELLWALTNLLRQHDHHGALCGMTLQDARAAITRATGN